MSTSGLTFFVGLVFVSLAIGTLTNGNAWGFLTFGAGLVVMAMLSYLSPTK